MRASGAAVAAVLLFTAPMLPAHDGTLDSYGCHVNLAHKIYHCHTGPLAGEQFKTRAEMLLVLQERDRERQQREKEKPKIETPREY